MCIKSDFKEIFLKLVANGGSDKDVSVDIKILSLGGCLPLTHSYLHLLNHDKEVEEIFFKTWNK